MWSWLPYELLQRIVQLVAERVPRALAIFALLNQQSRALAAAHLSRMKTLLKAPFRLTVHQIFSDTLELTQHALGSKHMKILGSVLVSGALAQLTRLDLDGNSIGDTGMSALASACASRALHKLKELRLYSNQIGDAGLSSLADAVSSGALDHLTVCWRLAALFQCLETWHVHSPYA